ncbi:BT_3928 family protein [Flavobacterium cellulosilyticum]|uniref:DoxX family membrane protein n=1 Tax=Flavobacterium cellulosilyticum TaxID=2541731 RepID=A0A4R5CF77_9FLAO|nr:BT_3928 family protein [Flavobacterium cellulosilyticum]TDD97040.1 DoxX family membrane protein [Flavobacterium cellulosilyticum]
MKNIITQFSRLFVGILFIISGLIKLNDPIGFSYKLDEYFSEPVFNMPFFIPFTLAIALFLVILEVVLGVLLLIGYKSKNTIWSLLLLVVLFTFLTFYSAYFNVVKDCGCFGDALHLTPWQSFSKDIILLFFILILFFNKKLIKPLFSNSIQNTITYLSIGLCAFMGYWVINHLPLKDFRPYKVGTNIRTSMEIPENAAKSQVEMVFIYKVNGVDKEFTEKDLMSLPEGATFVDRIDKVIVQGYVPPIHDFKLELEGQDNTQIILSKDKVLLIVAYNLEKSNTEVLKNNVKLYEKALSKGYYVAMLTGSSKEVISSVKMKYRIPFDILFCDATTLKTIERANPSFVLLNYGTIKQKVHYNDIDDLKL